MNEEILTVLRELALRSKKSSWWQPWQMYEQTGNDDAEFIAALSPEIVLEILYEIERRHGIQSALLEAGGKVHKLQAEVEALKQELNQANTERLKWKEWTEKAEQDAEALRADASTARTYMDGYSDGKQWAMEQAQPVASLYIGANGEREVDDWKCELPAGRHVLYTTAKVAQPESHPDDIAVDAMAAAMKEKLRLARKKGRGGWETCSQQDLSRMLREHVDKGDPRDVANFCAFLHALGFGIAQPAEPVEPADTRVHLAGPNTPVYYVLHADGTYSVANPQPAQPEPEGWNPSDKPMTSQRALYFMERFKKEEKLLGPNEQAAVDYVINMLETTTAQPAETWIVVKEHAWNHEDGSRPTLAYLLPSEFGRVTYPDFESASAFIKSGNWPLGFVAMKLDAPQSPTAQPEPIKDHEIAKLVGDIAAVAREFHDHQSLRERISQLVRPWAKPEPVELTDEQITVIGNNHSNEDCAMTFDVWPVFARAVLAAAKGGV